VLALALGGVASAVLHGSVFFDTTYYARWAHGALTGSQVPYRDFGWEYPPGALPAVVGPGLVERLLPGHVPTHGADLGYGVIWVLLMLAVDALVLRLVLRRTGGTGRHPAAVVWIYGPPLLGSISWARYDVLPAAAAFCALLAAGSDRAGRAGALAGIGGTLKIWPAVLAPIQRTRRAAVVATATMSAVLAGAAALTFLLTGSSGFEQVLRYQHRRGLQVESLAGLPFLWLHHLGVAGYASRFRYGAFEISRQPGPTLAVVLTGAQVVGAGLLLLAHWRFMRGDAGRRRVALTAMSVLLLTLLTDKVLSPQYLLWLLAVMTGACLLDPDAWRPCVPWVLAAAALTGAAFPWLYGDVLHTGWPGLVVLTARDLVLVGLAVTCVRRVLHELRRVPEPVPVQSRPPVLSA
jgi:hypothetical protein